MRIKIISDGKPLNTKVYDINTGKELTNITSIEWKIQVDQTAKAVITFIDVPIEVTAEVEA